MFFSWVTCRGYEGTSLLLCLSSYVFSMSCIYIYIYIFSGPGSSVGIATDKGLNGSGSIPDGDEIFRPSRPALGPTQAPVKWVSGPSRG